MLTGKMTSPYSIPLPPLESIFCQFKFHSIAVCPNRPTFQESPAQPAIIEISIWQCDMTTNHRYYSQAFQTHRPSSAVMGRQSHTKHPSVSHYSDRSRLSSLASELNGNTAITDLYQSHHIKYDKTGLFPHITSPLYHYLYYVFAI